ncbi:hypothetical protein AVEN_255022-1 [Araneus ventricosus]|uniref:Uncharacterized protein n=1 Tax=Araneus ventricosus TaxID=182803 RepID=A0A4Y2Q0P7_ARAVE|nr:hypothetical protein AVEN_255022-1 [Araneus ventricosus]
MVRNLLYNGKDLPHYTDSASKCKLPEIQLPTFDGNPREWLNFWTQFQKIDEEASIDDRDKYQYLIQSTVPSSAPREIVEIFLATAENYKKAIEYLKERFGKENVLVQVYIRDLLQLVISKNKFKLSSLYDKLQTRIRSLNSLGLTKDKYVDILFPLVESTLPIDILKMWDRQRHLVQDTQGKSDLDLLMNFVKNEVDSEFRIKISREIFNTGKITNKKSVSQYTESKAVVSTACELLTANDNNKYTENIHVLGITGSSHRQTAKELEEETTKYFNETLRVNAEGRYEVALPWVVDHSSLPENRKLAGKSLLSAKRKLMTSRKLEAYGEVFDNRLSLGIIEKIPQGETGRVVDLGNDKAYLLNRF